MDEFIPVPFGALQAVYRDPSADNGLLTLPIVGFQPPPSPGGVVFGGLEGVQHFAGPSVSANPGAVGIPVIITRRGEMRSVITHVPGAEEQGDPMFTAPVDIGLVPGEVPTIPEFLGIVQSHEEASEVFAPYVEAAEAHKAAVEAHRASQGQSEELPEQSVDAEVTNAVSKELPDAMRRDLTDLLESARAMANRVPANSTDFDEYDEYDAEEYEN